MQIRIFLLELFCKTVFWRISSNLPNSICAGVSFSIKLQAIGREHLFYGISGRLLLADILLKSYPGNFWKIPKKPPLKKSCFDNVGDSTPETLLKHNFTALKQVTYVAYMQKIISLTGTPHSHEFWENFKSVPEICYLFQ